MTARPGPSSAAGVAGEISGPSGSVRAGCAHLGPW